jgi:hypothetical protein
MVGWKKELSKEGRHVYRNTYIGWLKEGIGKGRLWNIFWTVTASFCSATF